MPKFNPLSLPPPTVRREAKAFKTLDGQEFTITLQASSGAEILLAMSELEDQLFDKWQHGGPSAPGCPPVRVTQVLCRVIARLLVMQTPSDGEDESDLWGFVEWAHLAQRDADAFAAVNFWASSITAPNPKATTSSASPGAVASSLPPPSTTPDGTPT